MVKAIVECFFKQEKFTAALKLLLPPKENETQYVVDVKKIKWNILKK